MTDAIGAITSSTISTSTQQMNYEQFSPEDLTSFESAFQGGESSSINFVDETKATDLSDRLLQHVMKIDDGYHHLFSKNLGAVPKANSINESTNQRTNNANSETSEMMRVMHETHAWGIDSMAFSLNLQLLTNTVTTISSGLSSLLKSGG